MTEISIPARIRAIEARANELSRVVNDRSSAGAPLGFGLVLESARTTTRDDADPSSVTSARHDGSGRSPAVADRWTTGVLGAPPGRGPLDVSGQPSPQPSTTGTDAIAPTSPLTPATRLRGPYGRLEPPAELAPYGNGRVPSSALKVVGDTPHRLHAPAASALTALIADAEAGGVTVGITDSYRPLEVQQRLAKQKGLYSQGGLAATPGTSNHGWGVATDLRLDGEALAWMRENAWRYGFVEDVPREPWHWTYRPD